MAKIPFSQEIKDLVITKLGDMNFVQEIVTEIYDLFRVISLFFIMYCSA
jgi:hypothetical protein